MKHNNFVISDEEPKEGDYVINTLLSNSLPKQLVRYSKTNSVLGIRGKGWFKWTPLSKYHKKVVFQTPIT